MTDYRFIVNTIAKAETDFQIDCCKVIVEWYLEQTNDTNKYEILLSHILNKIEQNESRKNRLL
jgi:hypothetical protein